MESVSERLHETRRNVLALVDEETRGWRRYVAQLGAEVRSALTATAIERRVLARVDETLRAMDERVKRRLAKLTRQPRRPRKKSRAKSAHGAPLAA
jgi:hypothetical protein